MRLRRIRRGYNEATLVLVSKNAEQETPGAITEFFTRELEREIRRAPAYWLWTHRRWKRGVPDEVIDQLSRQSYLGPKY